MTVEEADELANTALSKAEGPNEERLHGPLCCLACFRLGSLISFHQRLVDKRILYPGMIYQGASDEISRSLLNLLQYDEYRNHALTALA